MQKYLIKTLFLFEANKLSYREKEQLFYDLQEFNMIDKLSKDLKEKILKELNYLNSLN